MDKFTFNEDLKRIFNCLTNKLVLSQYILKDFISDVKKIDETNRKEKSSENNNTQNKNFIKTINDSSQTIVQASILGNKSSYNTISINQVNTSFLFVNSSIKSLIMEKLEGLIIECKWKKKYILLLKLSTSLQTILLIKFSSKNKIINEIINREFNSKDRKKIYDNICNWLKDDLTNVECGATTIVFANMKEVVLYLNDTRKILEYFPIQFNARFEIYTSPLMSIGKNCLVYDKETNVLREEIIFTGFYIDNKGSCEIRWEIKKDRKHFCISRVSIIYLEENMSLIFFRSIYQTYVPAKFLYDINKSIKNCLQDSFDYFNKKNKKLDNYNISKDSEMNLKIGIKNIGKDNKMDLNVFIQNDNMMNNLDINFEREQYNSFLDNSNFGNKDGENLFIDTIQNISEISKIQSAFLQGIEEEI